MSALVASLALVGALSRHGAPSALVSHPITCATNANVSDSGCGNTGIGNSGVNNTGNGNSGDSNTGNANSGTSNTGNANSGVGNVGNGNSGCGNTGVANSGGGNTGTALSGGFSCSGFTVPKTTPRTVPKPPHTLPTATTIVPVTGETLPLTGSSSTAPLTLAGLLLFAGGATVTLANRRRRALAAVTGAEVPMSTAVGLLLTGRAKPADTTEPAKR